MLLYSLVKKVGLFFECVVITNSLTLSTSPKNVLGRHISKKESKQNYYLPVHVMIAGRIVSGDRNTTVHVILTQSRKLYDNDIKIYMNDIRKH